MNLIEVALDLRDFRWWQTFDELPELERTLDEEMNTVEWRGRPIEPPQQTTPDSGLSQPGLSLPSLF